MHFVLMLFALLLCQPALTQSDLPPVAPAVACSDLTALDLTGIGGAGSAVSAAQETTSGGIAVCLVTGSLAPQVNFQDLLAMAGWTLRYLQLGYGGLCGNFNGCSDGGHEALMPDMTRRVWPWPATARFFGSDDPNGAAFWTQGRDAEIVPLRDRAGADFFTPNTPEN